MSVSLSSPLAVASTDAELADLVAAQIARPRADAADSFVLHAPLEALARTALLGYLPSSQRAAARERLAWVGDTYEAWGPPADEVASEQFDDAQHATAHLVSAIRHGDLDETDIAATWLASWLTPVQLTTALADIVVPRLSAAGHGSIFLFQLSRIAPRSLVAGTMLRGLARELARYPTWRLTWHERREPGLSRDGDLTEVLLAPRPPGDPGSSFIFPTMSTTEKSGLAAELLDRPLRGVRVRDAERQLLRVAASSMLQDDPDHAPYGWSHCLTMPQAVLGVAHEMSDPAEGVAVAATYVLGFRSTISRGAIDVDWVPEQPAGDVLDALDAPPSAAAAAAWHAEQDDVDLVWQRLVSRAAVHEDAHLAKYTLACLDATRTDPEQAPLYRAAAAYLGAWWAQLDRDLAAPAA
jgi:hypothetical protein